MDKLWVLVLDIVWLSLSSREVDNDVVQEDKNLKVIVSSVCIT